jgi:hypothetical protein
MYNLPLAKIVYQATEDNQTCGYATRFSRLLADVIVSWASVGKTERVSIHNRCRIQGAAASIAPAGAEPVASILVFDSVIVL